MTKLLLLIGLFLPAIISVQAQGALSVQSKIGKSFTSLKGSVPGSAVGQNDSLSYFMEYRRKGGNLQCILWGVNDDVSSQREVVLPMEYEGTEMDFQRIALSSDGQSLHLFTSFNNRRTDVSYLLVTDIDASTFETSEPRVILELGGATGKNRDYWGIGQTKSSGRLYVTFYIEGDKGERDVHMAVLDQDMSVAYQYTHPAASKDEVDDISVLAVAPDGTLYYCSTVGEPDRRRQISEKTFVLHTVKSAKDRTTQSLTTKQYRAVSEPTVILKKNGHLLAFGRLYDDKDDDFPGFYYNTYDSDLKVLTSSALMSSEDEGELITLGAAQEKLSKSSRKFMKFFTNSQLIEAENGGVYAIGTSVTYKQTGSTSSSRRTIDEWTYHNVLVTYLSPEGTPQWSKTMPLLVTHENFSGNPFPYTGGIAAEAIGDQLMVTCYDEDRNIDNVGSDPSYKPRALWKKMSIRHALFSPDGNFRSGRDRRFQNTKRSLLFADKSTLSPSGDGIIAVSYDDQRFKFVKVSPTQNTKRK